MKHLSRIESFEYILGQIGVKLMSMMEDEREGAVSVIIQKTYDSDEAVNYQLEIDEYVMENSEQSALSKELEDKGNEILKELFGEDGD